MPPSFRTSREGAKNAPSTRCLLVGPHRVAPFVERHRAFLLVILKRKTERAHDYGSGRIGEMIFSYLITRPHPVVCGRCGRSRASGVERPRRKKQYIRVMYRLQPIYFKPPIPRSGTGVGSFQGSGERLRRVPPREAAIEARTCR